MPQLDYHQFVITLSYSFISFWFFYVFIYFVYTKPVHSRLLKRDWLFYSFSYSLSKDLFLLHFDMSLLNSFLINLVEKFSDTLDVFQFFFRKELWLSMLVYVFNFLYLNHYVYYTYFMNKVIYRKVIFSQKMGIKKKLL